jgi:biopolymer transport protein TolR
VRVARRKLAHEINVVPYIDVMLVLLIIFMVTAPLLTQGIEVQLPESAAEAMANSEEPITLSINAKGQYFLDIGTDQAKPLSDDELVRRIGAVMHNQQKKLVLVKGDKRVDYGRVDWALGLLQEAGATNIGFASEALNRKKTETPAGKE